MEFKELIKARYSCKSYDGNRQISSEQLDAILEAGRLAPTAKNLQEQHIYVCQSPEALAKIGVPVLRTITGDGMFEGANAMWVDRHTCVVSTGVRCNKSGFEQVKYELERMGVDVYHMQQPYSNIHIDGLMNPIGYDKILVHASQVPYDVLDVLKKK